MPTYVYKCAQCKGVYEKIEGINDDPDPVCERCGAVAARRVPTVFGGIQLQGTGFYNTDYKNNAPPSEGTGSGGGCCPCGKGSGTCTRGSGGDSGSS